MVRLVRSDPLHDGRHCTHSHLYTSLCTGVNHGSFGLWPWVFTGAGAGLGWEDGGMRSICPCKRSLTGADGCLTSLLLSDPTGLFVTSLYVSPLVIVSVTAIFLAAPFLPHRQLLCLPLHFVLLFSWDALSCSLYSAPLSLLLCFLSSTLSFH